MEEELARIRDKLDSDPNKDELRQIALSLGLLEVSMALAQIAAIAK